MQELLDRRNGILWAMFAATLAALLALTAFAPARAANCSAGVEEINSAVEQYNNLKGCAKGTQIAVRAAILQRIIELRKQTEGCPNITGGNSLAELKRMLANLKGNAKMACDLEEMSSAIDDEIKRLDKDIANHERLAAAYGKLAEITGKAEPLAKSTNPRDLMAAARLYDQAAAVADGIEQPNLSKSFRKQADDLEKKAKLLAQKPKAADKPANQKKPAAKGCADARAYIDKLKAGGNDTAPLEKAYKAQGCE